MLLGTRSSIPDDIINRMPVYITLNPLLYFLLVEFIFLHFRPIRFACTSISRERQTWALHLFLLQWMHPPLSMQSVVLYLIVGCSYIVAWTSMVFRFYPQLFPGMSCITLNLPLYFIIQRIFPPPVLDWWLCSISIADIACIKSHPVGESWAPPVLDFDCWHCLHQIPSR